MAFRAYPAADHGEIAVTGTDLIHKGLNLVLIPQGDGVAELIEGAHIGGAHLVQRVAAGELGKEIVKNPFIVQVLRNGDPQIPAAVSAGRCPVQSGSG